MEAKEKPDYRQQPGKDENQKRYGKDNDFCPEFDDSILNPDSFINHISDIECRLSESENKFPVEVFPVEIQNIIHQTNECLKFPIDFIGASMLFAGSTVVGNSYKAQVMPGWVEGVTVYMALVGRAGTNKSHPLTFALQPIFDNDKRTFAKYKEARSLYQQAMMAKKGEQPEVSEKPFWKKFIINDSTPEALAEVHRYNLRGVGVYSDELAGWFKNFNRYHKGAETEFWLSNFSGKQITIDRKSQEPVLIPTPSISVCGSIQSGILKELQKDNRGENGFIDRILFVMPEGLQKEYWSEARLSNEVVESWGKVISNLISMPMRLDEEGNPSPVILEFSSEAMELLKGWQRKNTDQCNDPDNETMASVFSKLEIYLIRFSLILQLIKRAVEMPGTEIPDQDKLKFYFRQAAKLCHPDINDLENDDDTLIKALNAAYERGSLKDVESIYFLLTKPVIGVEAVEGAILLVEYFRNTAIKAHGIIQNSNPVETLSLDKKQLYKTLPSQFTTEAGLLVANKLEFHERKFERFITDESLFEKIRHGEYSKKIK